MTTIADTRAIFREWLYLPDTGALDATLGAVAANRLEGDPVWLLLVGPPGGGKSEILNSICGLHDAHPTGTLTEASLLSGTPKKEHADAARGGLLRAIGDYGIIVAKDFGSVLSMNRDARAQLLAALREVYDRRWTRHVGSDGGRTLDWEGKVGLVGGVTPTIDRHHAVMGAMGERFILYRLPEVDPNTQARQALSHAGKERQMRKELANAVQQLLEHADNTPRKLDEDEKTRLVGLATLAVKARSAVERDNYSREIELVPGPEAPTRLIVVLDRMLAGLDVIGVTRDDAWKVVTKLALDSVPALRLAVLYTLTDGQQDTNDISGKVRHPAQTTRRALEDLVAHGLVELERQGEGKAHLWSLSEFTTGRLQGFPETSTEIPTFPETSRVEYEETLISSSKERDEQNGKGDPATIRSTHEDRYATGHSHLPGLRNDPPLGHQTLPTMHEGAQPPEGPGITSPLPSTTATTLDELLDDPNLDDEDRRLIALYVHTPPDPPPGDLHDPAADDDIPF